MEQVHHCSKGFWSIDFRGSLLLYLVDREIALLLTYFQGSTWMCGRYMEDMLLRLPFGSSTCSQGAPWDCALENFSLVTDAWGMQRANGSPGKASSPTPGSESTSQAVKTLGPQSFPLSGMGKKGRCVIVRGTEECFRDEDDIFPRLPTVYAPHSFMYHCLLPPAYLRPWVDTQDPAGLICL